MEDSIDGDDPSYRTYHMMDWDAIHQTRLEDRCVACGRFMIAVDFVRNKPGASYEGRVCHHCKTIIWVRKGD